MKKAFLFLLLFTVASITMAQIKFVKPQDGLLFPKFNYQKDTSWRNLPLLKDTLKLNNYGLGRLNGAADLMPLINTPLIAATTEGYNMPVAVLNGKSNMPINKIEGFYTMPVVGSNMPRPQKIEKVRP